MKIKINNFQSLEDVQLEVTGLTVVVGRTNLGKSAIIRAVGGAFTNASNKSFVRQDAQHTEVSLQWEDGDGAPHHVKWMKGSGKNDYVVDGEELFSVGRGAPPHLGELGFRGVQTTKTLVDVQVASQTQPLFLLDEDGAVAAETISDLGRLAEIQKAMENAEKDRRQNKATLRVRQKDLQTAREDLKALAGLDEDLTAVARIQGMYREVERREGELERLRALLREAQRVETLLASLRGVQTIHVPVLGDLEGERVVTGTMRKLIAQEARLQADQDRLRGVSTVSIPELPPEDVCQQLEELRKVASQVRHGAGEIRVLRELVASLPDLPGLQPLEEEARVCGQMRRMSEEARTYAATYREARTLVGELKAEYERAQKTFHDTLHEAGVCPLCEQETR